MPVTIDRAVTLPWLPNGAGASASSRWGISSGRWDCLIYTGSDPTSPNGSFPTIVGHWYRVDDMVTVNVAAQVDNADWVGTRTTDLIRCSLPFVVQESNSGSRQILHTFWEAITAFNPSAWDTSPKLRDGEDFIRMFETRLVEGTPNTINRTSHQSAEIPVSGTDDFAIQGTYRAQN